MCACAGAGLLTAVLAFVSHSLFVVNQFILFFLFFVFAVDAMTTRMNTTVIGYFFVSYFF